MMKRFKRPVLVTAMAVFASTGLVAFGVERWFSSLSLEAERQQVRAALLPHAHRLASVLGRRITQIASLRAFVETVRSQADLERVFEPFSAGLVAGQQGLRAVEVVRGGRIVMVSPLAGNESALSVEFLRHPNELLRQGYRRALATDKVTIVGPVRLVQGGDGLILFQRTRSRHDPEIELVELVIDLPALLLEVGLPEASEGIAAQLLDQRGGLIASSHPAMTDDPVEVVVPGLDDRFVFRGAPAGGWESAVALRVLPLRLALATIVLLLTVVAGLLAGHDERLSREVAARTASLAQVSEEQRATIIRQAEAERALAASETRLRLALLASQTATFEEEVATGAVDWSPEAALVFGLEPRAALGDIAALLSRIDGGDAQRVRQAFDDARRVATQATFELRLAAVDGVTRWVVLHVLSRPAADGTIRRIVGTVTDISERRKLEEQFLHSQKMQAIGVLAGGIAHDFNNLLTVILGAGQMAKAAAAAPGTPPSVCRDLEEVLAAGERAAALTGQLLAFARRDVVRPAHLDVRDFVRGTGSMLHRLVGEHIRLETSLADEPVPVFVDQGQLTQVLMNLVLNARDAMPDGGVLRVALRTSGPPPGPAHPDEALSAKRYAVLSVTDTGGGIDPAIRGRIFDPFFTTKPVGQGTGLGLPTVYGIVRRFGGTVRFVTARGEGTTFNVFIPLDNAGSGQSPAERPGAAASSGAGRTVLIAEDEASLRTLMSRALQMVGYVVLTAKDGVAALEVARSHDGTIALLISDVAMPRLGGVELADALAAERPDMRILLVSGYPQRDSDGAAASLRGRSFLAKPFAPADLLLAAERALAART